MDSTMFFRYMENKNEASLGAVTRNNSPRQKAQWCFYPALLTPRPRSYVVGGETLSGLPGTLEGVGSCPGSNVRRKLWRGRPTGLAHMYDRRPSPLCCAINNNQRKRSNEEGE